MPRHGIAPMMPLEADLQTPSYDVSSSGAEFALRKFLISDRAILMGGKAINANEILPEDILMEGMTFISQGASAKVYRTTHIPTQQPLALKMIPVTTKDHRDEICSELSVLFRSIQSDYVLRMYGAFYSPAESAVCIPMEWMSMSLHDAATFMTGLQEKVIRSIAKQLLLGLSYLHQAKVIHRDIKPCNILLNMNGFVKIGDFGISKCDSSLKQPNSTYIGTQNFMSPERLNAANYGYEADVWSLGLSLVNAALGHNPWCDSADEDKTMTVFKIDERIKNNQLPRFPSHFSDAARNFLARCLTVDPEERSSCRDLLDHPFVSGVTEEAAVVEVKGVVTFVTSMSERASAAGKQRGEAESELSKLDDLIGDF